MESFIYVVLGLSILDCLVYLYLLANNKKPVITSGDLSVSLVFKIFMIVWGTTVLLN